MLMSRDIHLLEIPPINPRGCQKRWLTKHRSFEIANAYNSAETLAMSSRLQEDSHTLRLRPRRASCFDPQLRRRLALERHSKPGFIYHLYISSQDEGDPVPSPRLWRTYVSHALANHDALCWVLQQQTKAGARVLTYSKDEEYERVHEGRCSRICTDWNLCRELGKMYCAFTIEDRLY